MSQMYGADVAGLQQLATQFDRAAETLESCLRTVGQAVHGMSWVGPDATAFRSEWDGRDSAQLAGVVSQLRDCAHRLQAKSSAQEQASTVSAAPGNAGGECCDTGAGVPAGQVSAIPIPSPAPVADFGAPIPVVADADGGTALVGGVNQPVPVVGGDTGIGPSLVGGVPRPSPVIIDSGGADISGGANLVGGVARPSPVEVAPGTTGPGVVGPVTNPSFWYEHFTGMAEKLGRAEFGTPDSDHDLYNDNIDYGPTDPDRH